MNLIEKQIEIIRSSIKVLSKNKLEKKMSPEIIEFRRSQIIKEEEKLKELKKLYPEYFL